MQERLFGNNQEGGFFSHFLSNRKYVSLTIPYYEYLRGIIFIEDLRSNLGEEVPPSFDIAKLIWLLYDDFLTQVKRGGATHEQIAQYLISGMKKHNKVTKKEKRVMRSITSNLFEFETVEEETLETKEENDRNAYLTIRMRSSEVLRGEILLHDCEPFLKGIDISIEQVMAIVYLEFIETIKTQGNSLKVQKTILSHLKS